MRNPNLIGKLRADLPALARSLLDQVVSLASGRRLPTYLVGGPLRDLLLDRPSLDLDIAVEGDAMALAGELAKTIGGRAVVHPPFLTATIRLPGFHIDLITARSETYVRPGALPTVKPATIREDLLRRDFTINALALRLSGPEAGEILDLAGGRADLDARLVRVLHERSFRDDATRILRAVRYASRFGFEIEPDALAWLQRDLAYLETISGARIHRELARMLAEDEPEGALRYLHDLGAFAAIHPALHFETEHAAAFARLRELNPTGARASYSPVLAWNLTEPQALDLARRLGVTKPQREALRAMPGLRRLGPKLARPSLKRSALTEVLAPFLLPALWAFAALTEDPTVRNRILDYLTKARHERPHLNGDDLLALGVPQGPQLGDLIRSLRAKRLDREATSRQGEKRLVRRFLAEGDKARHHAKKAAASRSS